MLKDFILVDSNFFEDIMKSYTGGRLSMALERQRTGVLSQPQLCYYDYSRGSDSDAARVAYMEYDYEQGLNVAVPELVPHYYIRRDHTLWNKALPEGEIMLEYRAPVIYQVNPDGSKKAVATCFDEIIEPDKGE